MENTKTSNPSSFHSGNLPKVGIGLNIDGRRDGTRESLENQTMQPAKSVSKLWRKNLQINCRILQN